MSMSPSFFSFKKKKEFLKKRKKIGRDTNSEQKSFIYSGEKICSTLTSIIRYLFTFYITFPTELQMIIRNSLHCFYIFVVCREDNVYYFILRKHTIGFCLVYLQHYLWFKGQKTFYTRQVVYIFWCEKNQAVSSYANYLGMIYLTENKCLKQAIYFFKKIIV